MSIERGERGRADLVRLLDDRRGLGGAADEAAKLLDFEWRPLPAPRGETASATVAPADVSGELPQRRELPTVAFWRVVQTRYTALAEDDPLGEEMETEGGGQPDEGESPALCHGVDLGWPRGRAGVHAPRPSLAPWTRLRRPIEDLRRSAEVEGEVDLEALVGEVSAARVVTRLPRRARSVAAPRVVLIIDRSERLMPIWEDQVGLWLRLETEFGDASRAGGVAMEWWTHEPPSLPPRRGRTGRSVDPALARVSAHLRPGDVALVLGDLGLFGHEPSLLERWGALGRGLRARGVRPAALVPGEPDSGRGRLALRAWELLNWSGVGAAAKFSRPGRHGAIRRGSGDAVAEFVLTLLAFCVLLDPGLIRSLCSRLGLGMEGELRAWAHPECGRHVAGVMVSEELRRRTRAEFSRWCEDPRRRAIVAVAIDVARVAHGRLPRELWSEELYTLDVLGAGALLTKVERERAREFARRLDRALAEAGKGVGVAMEPSVRAWATRALTTRVPERAWGDPNYGEVLSNALKSLRELEPSLGYPPGYSLAHEEDEPETLPPRRRYVVRQVGTELHIRSQSPESAWPPSLASGSPLATFIARRAKVVVRAGPAQRGQSFALEALGVTVLPEPQGESMMLESDCEVVTLERAQRPEWASAAGRDAWGLWASFEVGGVEVRMRWVPPGLFLMGSPEDEVGRISREGPRRPVTLTQGYWMAEMPCTQALWIAVMGDNPSRFVSPRRPVERVSWEDVQRFLEAIHGGRPALRLRLPTEAEWEYACRAGAQTATYAGDLDLLGANNAPVLDAIAWYGGNSGKDFDLEEGFDSSDWEDKQYPHTKAGIRPVGDKAPNARGLFDMLGNVEEWTHDSCSARGPTPYTELGNEDPYVATGPERVVRGGSWFYGARSVRAAYRSWSDPGNRSFILGFRLVRGPALRGHEEQGLKQEQGTSPA